jgi:predicted Abi (CAAX) family protease
LLRLLTQVDASVEWLVVQLSTAVVGAILVNINPAYGFFPWHFAARANIEARLSSDLAHTSSSAATA